VIHTQSDTRSGSAELDVLIVVFSRRCRVWASDTCIVMLIGSSIGCEWGEGKCLGYRSRCKVKLLPAYVIGCKVTEVLTLRPFLRCPPYKAPFSVTRAFNFEHRKRS
jgi:hypothetical protein